MVSECLARIKVAFTTLSTYWQQRSVSPKSQDNGKHGNFERFVQRQYTLAEKCFSRIVMYIPLLSDSSL